jgi:hypothetical protein
MATLAAAVVFFGSWVVLGQRLYPLPLRWWPLAAVTLLSGVFVALGSMPQCSLPLRVGLVVVLGGVLWASGLSRRPARGVGQVGGSQPAAGS